MKEAGVDHPKVHMFDRLERFAARFFRRAGFRVAFAVLVPMIAFFGLAFLYRTGRGPVCVFYSLTGLFCPGCGSGRALYSILHGRILHALDFNPVFVLLLPLVIYLAIQGYLKVVTRKEILPGIPITLGQARFYTLLTLIYWVIRNIPVPPFNWLAP